MNRSDRFSVSTYTYKQNTQLYCINRKSLLSTLCYLGSSVCVEVLPTAAVRSASLPARQPGAAVSGGVDEASTSIPTLFPGAWLGLHGALSVFCCCTGSHPTHSLATAVPAVNKKNVNETKKKTRLYNYKSKLQHIKKLCRNIIYIPKFSYY